MLNRLNLNFNQIGEAGAAALAEALSLNSPDPQGPDSGIIRGMRGCSWQDYRAQCRSDWRFGSEPYLKTVDVSFRLVRTLR